MEKDMQEGLDKAQVLVEALPYIQRFNRKVIVIKYGGSAMMNEELQKNVIADAVLLSKYLLTAENLSAAALRAADLNGDKTVNAADLSLLKRQVLAAAK